MPSHALLLHPHHPPFFSYIFLNPLFRDLLTWTNLPSPITPHPWDGPLNPAHHRNLACVAAQPYHPLSFFHLPRPSLPWRYGQEPFLPPRLKLPSVPLMEADSSKQPISQVQLVLTSRRDRYGGTNPTTSASRSVQCAGSVTCDKLNPSSSIRLRDKRHARLSTLDLYSLCIALPLDKRWEAEAALRGF